MNTIDGKADKNGFSAKLRCKNHPDTALKLSDDWYVRDGSGKQHNCGPLKVDATAYIAKCLIADQSGELRPRTEPILTWEDGEKEFTKYYKEGSNTLHFYEGRLKALGLEFAGSNLVDVTPARLQEFIEGREEDGIGARTRAGEVGTVKRMFVLVTRHLKAKEYPRLHEAMMDIEKMEKPAVDNYKDNFWTSEQVNLLISKSPEYLALAIKIQIHTGLRPGNVHHLKFSDIADDGTITVAPEDTKNGKPFRTKIPLDLVQDIKIYRLKRGIREWVFPSDTGKGPVLSMAKAFGIAVKAAELTGTPHKLRHSFASIQLGQGMSLVMVSALMGHANVNITMTRYGHLEQKHKVEALEGYWEKAGFA